MHDGDRAILFVGHSNTVTDIVLAFRADAAGCVELLGLAAEGIPEARYGDLWKVELEGGKACRGAVSRIFLGDANGVDCATP